MVIHRPAALRFGPGGVGEPTIRHQQVVMRVIVALCLRAAGRSGAQVLTAPTCVLLSDRDMPEPDVLVVSAEHRDRLGERYVEARRTS